MIKSAIKRKPTSATHPMKEIAPSKNPHKRKRTTAVVSQEPAEIAIRKAAAKTLDTYKVIYAQEAHDVDLMLSGLGKFAKLTDENSISVRQQKEYR